MPNGSDPDALDEALERRSLRQQEVSVKQRSRVRWLLALGALLVASAASAAEVHVMISAGFYEVY